MRESPRTGILEPGTQRALQARQRRSRELTMPDVFECQGFSNLCSQKSTQPH